MSALTSLVDVEALARSLQTTEGTWKKEALEILAWNLDTRLRMLSHFSERFQATANLGYAESFQELFRDTMSSFRSVVAAVNSVGFPITAAERHTFFEQIDCSLEFLSQKRFEVIERGFVRENRETLKEVLEELALAKSVNQFSMQSNTVH